MNTTHTYDTANADSAIANNSSAVIAAVFTERERAHDAVHRLHDEGFRDTWIGLTRNDQGADDYGTGSATVARPGVATESSASATETRVESENWFTRFFGDGDESLYDALVRHGVAEADARAAGPFPAHSAILTVGGFNHPELAAQIVTEAGGEVITGGFGATGYGTTGAYQTRAGSGATQAAVDVADTTPDPRAAIGSEPSGTMYGAAADVDEAPTARTTSLVEDGADAGRAGSPDLAGRDDRSATVASAPATGTSQINAGAGLPADSATAAYDDYGRYRGGQTVDESTRLQLREERLRVDKSRISRGEAVVGTQTVTETHDFDVPLIREELFIERRPASGATTAAGTDIGNGEVVRVPLSEERVVVTKTPVVSEEVVIGKREVENTEHISETTRKEQLDVKDVDAGAAVRQ